MSEAIGVKYRGYIIERTYPPIHGTWYSVTHEDYDGPEDIRSSTACSIDEAKKWIDLIED